MASRDRRCNRRARRLGRDGCRRSSPGPRHGSRTWEGRCRPASSGQGRSSPPRADSGLQRGRVRSRRLGGGVLARLAARPPDDPAPRRQRRRHRRDRRWRGCTAAAPGRRHRAHSSERARRLQGGSPRGGSGAVVRHSRRDARCRLSTRAGMAPPRRRDRLEAGPKAAFVQFRFEYANRDANCDDARPAAYRRRPFPGRAGWAPGARRPDAVQRHRRHLAPCRYRGCRGLDRRHSRGGPRPRIASLFARLDGPSRARSARARRGAGNNGGLAGPATALVSGLCSGRGEGRADRARLPRALDDAASARRSS